MMKKTLALLLAALLILALAACGGRTQSGGSTAPQEAESAPAETPAREEDTAVPAREDAEAPAQGDGEAETAAAPEGTEAREPDPDGDGESIEVTATAGDLQPLEPAGEARAPIASAGNLQLTAPEGSDLERVLQNGALRVGVAPGTLQSGVWASAEGSVAASFAASLGLRLIPTEGEPAEQAALLEQGELDCLWGDGVESAERAALLVDGETRTVSFCAGSALRPLFADFLSAARDQGALETIGEYYGVTVEPAG